ncbi:MAG: DUF2974 domain-containing protein [Rickettsia endosymbiont of Sergentomyia squamirostris]|uniref:DUF2974 domain-containing protein n=1 Tax=Candidatus Tisiphia endosymbiont of Sergentomyia squamirostris TaxID=3113639 RepID=A0AAT9G7L9_9RICK
MPKSKLNFDQITTNLAYKVSNSKEAYESHELEVIEGLKETSWQVLCNSSQNEKTNQYDYKAVAFVNHITKEVHISSAGTKPTEKYDLIDDGFVAFGRVPYKIEQAKEMVNQVIDLLGGTDEAAKYTFSTSGHSLGAIISDLTGVDIISRELPFAKSITFDNPGSAPIVQRAIDAGYFTGKVEVSIKELASHCEVYNAKPNFINNTNSQLGNSKLVLPKKVETVTQDITESSGFWGFGKYLYNTIGSTIKSCSDYLGITSVVKQIEDHSLKNFVNIKESATVVQTNNWQKIDGKLVVEKFAGSDKVTSTGNDVVLFSEEEYDSMISINTVEYGYDDLSRAKTCTQQELDLIGADSFNDVVLVY